ncbi:hypothetical protein OSB04_003415 [Centaurea solstitialis]|uniref:Uncharacterized protein n=1 Tax=Centaurea solstitialis TaxID=347529 RepID=A0AA38TV33_9ASTR|nr:hypothetical protein OSB04_003415 [Centaurea solstitialis]
MNPSDIHAPRPKRSKTSETDSPGSSDAHTQYFNVDNDDDIETPERPRPLGRNAARRAGSTSMAGASSDNVTTLLEQLNAYNASNDTYIETMVRNADARYERQRSADFQIYMQPHDHLTGVALEVMLQENERMRKNHGWPPMWYWKADVALRWQLPSPCHYSKSQPAPKVKMAQYQKHSTSLFINVVQFGSIRLPSLTPLCIKNCIFDRLIWSIVWIHINDAYNYIHTPTIISSKPKTHFPHLSPHLD